MSHKPQIHQIIDPNLLKHFTVTRLDKRCLQTKSKTLHIPNPQNSPISPISPHFHHKTHIANAKCTNREELESSHGHKERKIQECTICLAKHQEKQCNSQLCSRCGSARHRVGDCLALGEVLGLGCRRCGRFWHREEDCRVIAKCQKDKNLENHIDDMKLVKCLKCNELGHFNCHTHPKQIPKIYPDS